MLTFDVPQKVKIKVTYDTPSTALYQDLHLYKDVFFYLKSKLNDKCDYFDFQFQTSPVVMAIYQHPSPMSIHLFHS